MKLILMMIMLSVSFSLFAKGYPKKCTFDFKSYCAAVDFIKSPSRSYSSDFKLYFFDKKSKKITMPKYKVGSYIWMNMDDDHSHGSSPVEIKKNKDHYLISNVWFVMIGQWELYVSLSETGTKNKVIEKKKTLVNIGRK